MLLAYCLSIGLYVLSFLSPSLGPLCFISLIPWFWVLDTQPRKQGCWFSFILTFSTMLVAHHWMLPLGSFAPFSGIIVLWLAYSAYLTLPIMIGTYVAYHVAHRAVFFSLTFPLMGLARLWLPYGSPAGDLQYALAYWPDLVASVSVIGQWGLLLIISVINLGLYYAHRYRLGILVSVSGLMGLLILPISEPIIVDTLPFHAIQPMHAQHRKLKPSQWHAILNEYQDMTNALDNTRPLVIWPETVVPANLTHHLQSYRPNTTIILGLPRQVDDTTYNAISQLDRDGISSKFYAKQILMPLGENLPLRYIIRRLGLDLSQSGEDYTAGTSPQFPIVEAFPTLGTAICLEIGFDSIFREQVAQGAQGFVVVSNHAWFGRSLAADFVTRMAVFRALDVQRDIVVCANYGRSVLVRATGEIYQSVDHLSEGILSGAIWLRQ